MVRQVIVNLLANALGACESGDAIAVTLSEQEHRQLALTINDTGQGIGPDDLPLVTRPYFTRREDGTGLGLAIVDQVVQAHGWRLEIESELDKGTTVRICIPSA